MHNDFDIIIIGSGVIGLAIAKSLAETKKNKSVLIIEKEKTFGRGISSRSSEVIHSGVYYPKESNKGKYCVKGRELIYDFCINHNIWHKKCGKIIVAENKQKEIIEKLYSQASKNLIPGIKIIGKNELNLMAPGIIADLGLFIGCTGIVSTHDIMSAFYKISFDMNHDYIFNAKIVNSKKTKIGYKTSLVNPYGNIEEVTSEFVINSAGLNSDIVGRMLDDSLPIPDLRYSKGCYFKLPQNYTNRFKHLIYPVPDIRNGTLGIHITFDQNGQIRLGPNAEWLKERKEEYNVESELKELFFAEASKIIKGLKKNELSPDYAGIRPKIKNINNNFSDFYISEETKLGYPKWFNLIGIESPGITSSIAIGNDIASQIN